MKFIKENYSFLLIGFCFMGLTLLINSSPFSRSFLNDEILVLAFQNTLNQKEIVVNGEIALKEDDNIEALQMSIMLEGNLKKDDKFLDISMVTDLSSEKLALIHYEQNKNAIKITSPIEGFEQTLDYIEGSSKIDGYKMQQALIPYIKEVHFERDVPMENGKNEYNLRLDCYEITMNQQECTALLETLKLKPVGLSLIDLESLTIRAFIDNNYLVRCVEIDARVARRSLSGRIYID